MFNIIIAHNAEFGIGLNGNIPWKNSQELKLFREITDDSILIMGRKTVETLPFLNNRKVFCISRKGELNQDNNNSKIFNSIDDALTFAEKEFPDKKIFVAGGAEIYREALEKHYDTLYRIYVSIIQDSTRCDVHFDIYHYISDYNIVFTKSSSNFTHYVLQKDNKQEEQYLELLEEVLEKGIERETRNGFTKSLFCKNMTYDLTKGFPLLTTKKMFFRGVVEELLFFLRGDTDTKKLEAKGINIWNPNTERKFLDKIGKTERDEGIMGPMYGYQWRFFNAPYDEKSGQPSGENKGYDQLKMVIETIKKDPTSRRIIMTDYNPMQAEQGVLYPCHSIMIQFYVSEKYLDMYCYNRSQDLFLGTPFNIASSALLLSIVAKVTGLIARHLHMGLGDVHIYNQHKSQVREQIERSPFPFPQIRIEKELNNLKDIEELQVDNIVLKNYNSFPTIKAEMVA